MTVLFWQPLSSAHAPVSECPVTAEQQLLPTPGGEKMALGRRSRTVPHVLFTAAEMLSLSPGMFLLS